MRGVSQSVAEAASGGPVRPHGWQFLTKLKEVVGKVHKAQFLLPRRMQESGEWHASFVNLCYTSFSFVRQFSLAAARTVPTILVPQRRSSNAIIRSGGPARSSSEVNDYDAASSTASTASSPASVPVYSSGQRRRTIGPSDA